MKDLLKCSSLIRVAAIKITMASVASKLNVGAKMVVAKVILIMAGLLIFGNGNITAATTEEVNFRLCATYTNPETVKGPLSFGLTSLPAEVNSSFQFTAPLPESGVPILPSITSASFILGNAVLSEEELYKGGDDVHVYPIFTFSLDSEHDIDSLQYGFLFTNNVVTEGIVLNSSFEMNIKGTDIASGEFFHYKYTTSSQTLTVIPDTISIDIKPQSCPNPLNVKSKGVLPVAILGTADLDVRDIDITTLRLNGVAPVKSGFEDIATPTGLDPCDCLELSGNGSEDLTLKFDIQAIVTVLGDVQNGEEIPLMLTGMLQNGTTIEGIDCIVIKGGKKADDGPVPCVPPHCG